TLQGVIGYRDIGRTRQMIATAVTHKRAVVIGGGLLGLEAANALSMRGMHVTVIHNGQTLLERPLAKTSGLMMQAALEKRAMSIRL
ncbi:NAD-binding protein, partial [Pseudomonas syringae group genomosp. 7]|uniref:NAD-binding protein n=1 Tax=Pseudomonas syringae group genomosp. 7 TaxID=251699 RepID=UPI00376F975E